MKDQITIEREQPSRVVSEADGRPRVPREHQKVMKTFLITMAIVISIVGAYHFKNFAGLQSAEAMDMAQLARNILDGRGFTTNYIRPLMIPQFPNSQVFPEVVNPPLYPMLLAVFLSMGGPDDFSVALLSLILFAGSCMILFALVMRLSGSAMTASLTVVVFSLSSVVLSTADSGRSILLTTCLLLAMLYILTPNPSIQAPSGLGLRTFFGAGIIAALCYLTDYISVLYVVPVALFWSIGSGGLSSRAILSFVLGFAVMASPWWIRNFLLTGNPFYTLQLHELEMQTNTYPGYSHYRELPIDEQSTLMFMLTHFREMVKKVLQSLSRLYNGAPFVSHLYLMPFIVGSIWILKGSRMHHYVKIGVLGSFLLLLAGAALLGRNVDSFVPLCPLLSYLGIATFQRVAATMMSGETDDGRRYADRAPVNRMAFRFGMAQGLVLVAVIGVLAFPVMAQVFLTQRPGRSQMAKSVSGLARIIPPQKIVLSDIPWAVAWYGQRKAMWIPNRVGQVTDLEKRFKPAGIHLSRALLSYSTEEQLREWQQLYIQRRPIAGYTVWGSAKSAHLYYQRPPTLEEAEEIVKKQANNPEAHFMMGRTYHAAKKYDKSLAEFLKAQRGKSKWEPPYTEAGNLYLNWKKPDEALGQFEKALQINPRSVGALLGEAEIYRVKDPQRAIDLYLRALAESPSNLVAINNLAYIFADIDRDLYRALEYARRAERIDPRNGMVLDTLGWVLVRMGRSSEAVDLLNKAVSLQADYGPGWYHYGKALLATGKKKQAADALGHALSVGGLSTAEKIDTQQALQAAVQK